TAVSCGTATITATVGNTKATYEVTVNVPVESIDLSETYAALAVGQTLQLEASVQPSNACNQTVAWHSSNTTVATVASNGKVTVVGNGTATITATTDDGGSTAFCTINATVSGIEDIANQGITIFPNPVKDELFIDSETAIQKVEIYSITGALLLEESNVNEKINVSALPQGLYVVKLYTNEGISSHKLQKE
ncbi:MAG: Ig-like domain-containing protein, partial [Lentimicrobiaceae bacterium]|nr:Ig-like domain-containing protein [Lentimicrobiaceae bacterium]